MYRKANRTSSPRPATRARAVSLQASRRDDLQMAFGFAAIGILLIALVAAILRAGQLV